MKKNKLLMFLALNALVISGGTEKNSLETKYNKLYNNITKNIETGKSNDKNYKLIEKILNKRNKEIKNLYLQNDYIVKPEYLEWQVFFSSFYDSINKKGNNTNQNFLEYPMELKSINLGFSLPDITPNKSINELDIEVKEKKLPPFTIPNIIVPVNEIALANFDLILNLPGFGFSGASKDGDITGTLFSALGEEADVNSGNNYVVNNTNLTYNGTAGSSKQSGKFMSIFTMSEGKLVNNANISMEDTSNIITPFHLIGVYVNNTNQYLNIENNGRFNFLSQRGPVGIAFLDTVSSENPEELTPLMFTKDPQKVILSNGIESKGAYVQNYGIADMSLFNPLGNMNSIFLSFSGKSLDYISHLPGKKVGNIITGEGDGIHLKLKNKTPNDKLRIDPGIIMMNKKGNGIVIDGMNAGQDVGEVHILNFNKNPIYADFSTTSNDRLKDSQIVLMSNVGGRFGYGVGILSHNISSNAKIHIDIPIYIAGLEGIAISSQSYTHSELEHIVESDIIFLYPSGGGHTINNKFGSIIYENTQSISAAATGITLNSGTLINRGTITNIINDPYNIQLNDGTTYNLLGSPTGIDSNIGVHNDGGTFIQEGGAIRIGGNSYGIWNSYGNIILKNTELETGSGTIGMILASGDENTLKIIDSNIKIGENSTFLYALTNPINNKYIEFEGINTAEIGKNSLGIVSINHDSNFDFSIYKNLKNIKFTLESGATLFSIFDFSLLLSLKLSDMPSLEEFNIDPISSENSFTFSLISINNSSEFHVDQNVNLDEDKSLLKRFNSRGSNIIIDSGIAISGTSNNIKAIRGSVMEYPNFPIAQSRISNQGIINLTGDNVFGTIVDYGKVTNTNFGQINVTGTNGVGIYGENSSDLINNGNILIGTNGVGIYARSYTDPSTPSSYGSGKINVTNTGNITALDGEGAIGIYINNNKSLGLMADSVLNLNGKIDVSKSQKGVGLYINKTTVTDTTGVDITVGKNGTGIYAKDSSIILSNLKLNLNGDNALGLYLEGNTDFTGSGNININGKGVVLFNLGSSVIFNSNLIINSTSGSSYVANMSNNAQISITNTTINLGTNGIGILGKNTAVLLDDYSTMNGTGSNITGIALTGHATTNISGTSADVTNRGKIIFENSSIGIYGENDLSFLNDTTGIVRIGSDGTGAYLLGNDSSAENKGLIEIGENSHGIYLKDSSLYAKNSGEIKGFGDNTIGIFLGEGNALVENNGKILLSGNKTVGIYNIGTGNTINTNKISIGNSTQKENPGIGIYGINNIINNSGEIIAGVNSLGIYNLNGTVNQNSTLTIGSEGTGIYVSGTTIDLGTNSVLNLDSGETTGVYAKSASHIINNGVINTESGNIVFALEDNSSILNNRGTSLKGDSVFIYSLNGGIIDNSYGADITMSDSNNTGIYSKNGGSVLNKGNITGDTGIANTGIYNNLGSIKNYGNIKLGDSLILDKERPFENSYSVGIYGNGNTSLENYGDIQVGKSGIGIYIKDDETEALNKGNITSLKNDAVGIYVENSTLKNEGNITLSGEDSIGIIATSDSTLINKGTITMNGEGNIGIYANINSTILNDGEININGNNSIGIQLLNGSMLENTGEINIAAGLTGSKDIVGEEAGYTTPSIINAGVIKVDEKFEINGFNLTIKVDPDSIRIPTIEEITLGSYDVKDLNGGFLLSNTVSIKAPSFDLNGNAVKIDPLFTQGTNARVYKFENVFDPRTPEGGPNSGEVTVSSGSLTFDAIPVINKNGGVDIWMEKINYNEFTQGTWQNEFAENIEEKYLNATGDALKLYDRLDLITEKSDLHKRFGELSGEVYSNMNQREEIIGDILEDSLSILRTSKNNTKENVKINVIAGKGKSTEKTPGVLDYNYTTTGAQLLREVERTYRHTFGYSLGYTHTNFKFEDGNDSEEQADTIQLGIHNKYTINGWELRNDLTGRVSLYNIDRNINWNNNERTELSGHYETYSITSDNRFGKELSLGKQFSLIPYGSLKSTYMTRDSFKEKGTAGVEVKGNDAWSVKPRAGIELKGILPLSSSTSWQMKSSLDIAYEYELVGLEKEEKAKLGLLEKNYHKLSKPDEDKGKLRTKATLGVEVEDRYGIFLLGEYAVGNRIKNDYRIGLNLKAVF